MRTPSNTDGGDVVRGFALTPVIAIRDSDEITAVWLVPQLVLLKTSQRRKTPAVPSGGVRNVEDTAAISGYKPKHSRNDERPPKTAFPPGCVPENTAGGSSSLEGRSVAVGFPFRRVQYSSCATSGTTRQVSLDG